MERYVILVISILFASTMAPPPKTSKQYRSDYSYNKKTNAFYKLHIENVMQYRAVKVCLAEGATLMVPTRGDVEQVHGMLKQFPDIGDLVWVGSDGEKHESAEEVPIIDLREENDRASTYQAVSNCDVVTRKGDIETTFCYKRMPFVCKVDATEAPYDDQCQVYALGYQYFATVHSCYKASQIAFTWDEAYAECRAEGAHLVVINSETEQETVWDVLRTAPRLSTAHTDYFYFAGIRANKPSGENPKEFRTVFNETLEQAGYAGWTEGEPNNHRKSEYCGSLFRNDGKYNDVDCTNVNSFICEKEVPSNV